MAEQPVDSAAELDDRSWTMLTDAVRRLEESWRTDGGAELADFVLRSDDSHHRRVLIELVKVDQEYRWKSGEQKKLEEYLREWPELREESEVLVELLAAECLTRGILDEMPSLHELRSRFAEICDRVDLDAIEAEAHTERWFGDDATGATAPVTPKEGRAPLESNRPLPLPVVGRFGRYEIRGLLGRGAMGTVYRAYDTQLKREIALKIPQFDPTAEPTVLERFIREARAAAAIQHPNICTIHDTGQIDGVYYIAMVLIEGPSLAAWMEGHKVDCREAAELVQKIARALDAAHAAGVVHRDIKPSNVMINQSGEPVLMDFGLARETQSDTHLTRSGSFLGTLAYMSPEQAKGESRTADRRTDIYSLGVILFQLITGDLPFRGTAQMLLKQVVEEEPSSPRKLDSHIPRDLETICLRCLEKEPRRRYGSASELADELGRFLNGEAIHARPITRAARFCRWCRRKPLVAGLAAALAVVLLAGAGVSTYFAVKWRDEAQIATQNAKEARKEKARADIERDDALFQKREADSARAEANKKEQEAQKALGREKAARAEARKEQQKAQEALGREKTARKQTEVARKQTEESLYFNRIALAHQKWLADDACLAEDLLDACPPKLRNWEWKHLKWLCQLESLTIPGPLCPIEEVALSPGGNMIASKGSDGAVRVWDLMTGRPVAVLPGIGGCMGFSPAGTQIVVPGYDEKIKVWDTKSGRLLHTRPGPRDPVAISPDFKWIASAPGVRSGGCTSCVPSAATRSKRDAGTGNPLRIWDVKAHKYSLTLRGHSGPVVAVAFRHDSRQVASASDKTVRIWDLVSGRELYRLEHLAAVNSVAFSPDGQRIVTGRAYGMVNVWDIEKGKILHRFHGPSSYLALSQKGDRIAAGENGSLKVWDVSTGNELFAIPGKQCAAFSPDGKRLVVAGLHNTLRVWDLTHPPHPFRHFTAGKQEVTSRNRKLTAKVIGEKGEKTVKIQKAESGKELFTLRGHTCKVTSVAFSPDSTRIITASADCTACTSCTETGSTYSEPGTVKIWDATTGQELLTLQGPGEHVMFDDEGEQIAAWKTEGEEKLWNSRAQPNGIACSTSVFRGHIDVVASVVFDSDSQQLIAASDDHAVQSWDLETHLRSTVPTLEEYSPYAVALGPRGRLVALAGKKGSNEESIVIYDRNTRQPIHTLGGHKTPIRRMAFSLDESHLVSASERGAVSFWRLDSEQLPRHLGGQGQDFQKGIAISSNGRYIVGLGLGDNVRVWDATTGKTMHALSPPVSSVSLNRPTPARNRPTLAQWRPSREQTVSVAAAVPTPAIRGRDETSVLRPIPEALNDQASRPSPTQRDLEERSDAPPVGCVAFSPDSKLIAATSSSGTVTVWDVESGEEIAIFKGHEGPSYGVAFSPTRRMVVTAGADGAVRLWNLKDGREVDLLRRHDSPTIGAAFSPDGKLLASVGSDSSVRIWNLDDSMIEQMASWAEDFEPTQLNNGKDNPSARIARYDEAIKHNPRDADAYCNRGAVYREMGYWDSAFDDFTEAIRLKPTYARAFVHRGLVQQVKGDYDKAIADYTKGLHYDPENALAYNNRGAAYEKKGDLDRAIADYTRAIRYDPRNAEAYRNRGKIYQKWAKLGRDYQFKEAYETVTVRTPDGERRHTRRVLKRNKIDPRANAKADFTKAKTLTPPQKSPPAFESGVLP